MAASASCGPQLIGTQPDGRQLMRVACALSDPFTAANGQNWCQIVPEGPFIKTNDGRSYFMSDPLAVAATSSLPLLVDWEHESTPDAFMGSTKAAGWLEELRVQLEDAGEFPRPGIWGRVHWTPPGAYDVENRIYRFFSPVILVDPETKDIQEILSVALTNTPALHMQSLDSFSQQFSARTTERGEQEMKPELVKIMLAALAIGDDASEAQVITAVESLKAKPPAGPTTEAFSQVTAQVATLTTALGAKDGELAALKSQLDAVNVAAFSADVARELDAASVAGKVPPAARAGYEAMCSTREGFETFKSAILPHLVTIAGTAPKSVSTTDGKADSLTESLKSKGFTIEEINAAKSLRVNGQATAEEN